MGEKTEALKRWTRELEGHKESVEWLGTLEGKKQATTIEDLEVGIKQAKITVRDALIFSLIVGVQWHEKFEGIP